MKNKISKKAVIFISIAIMVFASVSLFAQYGRGYGRRGGGGAGYCGYGRSYNNIGYRYNNNSYKYNYNGCYYNNISIK